MIIQGKRYRTLDVFDKMMTVPDCIVAGSNKIGKGNGEAKFYITSKDKMYDFYGKEGFKVNCFMLKSDLLAYMYAIENEYLNPSQEYRRKEDLPELWKKRLQKINKLDEVIYFTLEDQNQISGIRGYVKSSDEAYKLLREIALPLVSYIYCEKVGDKSHPLFYWKLYVDFNEITQRKAEPLVFTYRKKGEQETAVEPPKKIKKEKEIGYARKGQGEYRRKLLDEMPYCPITKIADERLLIASHIKPWAVSNDREKTDPKNGYVLSPMYDRLFDQGFITFTPKKNVVLSNFLSPGTWKKIGLTNMEYISMLPMDPQREKYLEFHHESVFKGSYKDNLI